MGRNAVLDRCPHRRRPSVLLDGAICNGGWKRVLPLKRCP